MRIPVEYVELRSQDGSLGPLRVLLGDAPITPSGGGGGWEAVERPGRRPILVWRQPDSPYRMLLPLLFDGWADGGAAPAPLPFAGARPQIIPDKADRDPAYDGISQESRIRVLEKMAGVNVPGDPEPPLLIVEGSLPHDHSNASGNRWVIEKSPEWGDAIRRDSDGARVRQAATIQLALHTEDDRLGHVHRPHPHPRHPTLHAMKGDTFHKIAARRLADYGGARLGARLARFNGKRSPDTKLKTGTVVKLPTTAQAQDWKRDLKTPGRGPRAN